MAEHTSRQKVEAVFFETLQQIEQRLSTLPGFTPTDPFPDSWSPPESLHLHSFRSDQIAWGRILCFRGEGLPSVFSTLLLPRLDLNLPAIATLQTVTDEKVSFVLLDAVPLDEESLQRELVTQIKELESAITPGAISLNHLPPALTAQMGPAAWLWRGLDHESAQGTAQDLLQLFATYLDLLPQAATVSEETQLLRKERRNAYVQALRRSEERARDNLGRMLGDPEMVDLFLDRFYLPIE